MDLYNYNVQVLQYHLFTVMPGALSDVISNNAVIDYNMNKVAIIDIRTGDEVMRWPLHDCGNGVYNATAFEQCDYAAAPPAPTAAPYATYVYPTSPRAGIFYNMTTKDYYLCSGICQQYTINLCGDGIQSNGPANTDGRETCDEGTYGPTGGCINCQIQNGWECLVWGQACAPKCGNGRVDPPYINALGVLQTEMCDLGTLNSNAGNDGDRACSTTCTVRGTYLWDCHTDATTLASTCIYLCGNGWLDLAGGTPVAGGTYTAYQTGGGLSANEPCDVFSQPYTGMVLPAGTING